MDPETIKTAATLMGGVNAALSAAKAMRELTGGLIGRTTDPATRKDLMAIDGELVALQTAQLELKEKILAVQEENSHLRGQLAAREDWKATADKYRLVTVGSSTVYQSIEEPLHCACPDCFHRQQLNILQRAKGPFHRCAQCKTEHWLGQGKLSPI